MLLLIYADTVTIAGPLTRLRLEIHMESGCSAVLGPANSALL